MHKLKGHIEDPAATEALRDRLESYTHSINTAVLAPNGQLFNELLERKGPHASSHKCSRPISILYSRGKNSLGHLYLNPASIDTHMLGLKVGSSSLLAFASMPNIQLSS